MIFLYLRKLLAYMFLQEILQTIKKKMKANSPSWKPLKHGFINDNVLTETIHEKGYVINGKLNNDQLHMLKSLYSSLHDFQHQNGGMFYSVYSRDISYRKQVHYEIQEILQPIYDALFHNYKVVLNSFIVKVSGPESEFSLHQDSTGLDEMNFSCLSVWIPLQDTNLSNGCLSVVPHSHKMFSPYRGISFPQQFETISNTVRKYLQPIEMQAGEILLFDNRLIHTSGINNSGKDRVVVMSGIFPSEAKLISCYKDNSKPNSPIEIIEQTDDYLLSFENFFHDCTCRPETGKLVGVTNWDVSQMPEKEFLKLCAKYGVVQNNKEIFTNSKQTIIGEPF